MKLEVCTRLYFCIVCFERIEVVIGTRNLRQCFGRPARRSQCGGLHLDTKSQFRIGIADFLQKMGPACTGP